MKTHAAICSLAAVALLGASNAFAIPQPPHGQEAGIQCLDCHVPYASQVDPAASTGAAGAGSTPLALVDATKTWADGQWVDGVVTFVSGANNGQYRYVTANTANTVQWALALPAPLTAGDNYILGKTTLADIETKCRSCHNPTGMASGMADVGLHPISGGRSIGCGDCHDPHNIDPNSGRGNGLIRRDVRWPTSTDSVAFPAAGPNPYVAGGPGFDGICETCHTQTKYHRNDATGNHTHNAGIACTACHGHGEGFRPVGGACDACHGSAETPAPPRSLNGSVNTADVEVGAHLQHLRGGFLRGPVECGSCHIVPAAVDDATHIGASPAEVTFAALAVVGGALPTWDRGQATCANVYCHGATLTGGTNTAPTWTRVDGTQAACGTCHGAPPPAPHPDRADCHACHSATVRSDGALDLAGGHHIDGVVDVGRSCNACHGTDAALPAPPTALNGSSDTTYAGVGAHQSHLMAGALRAAVRCQDCHVVPNAVGDPGHLDAAPADLTFSALATAGGLLAPSYDPVTERCANTYCHGATLPGGSQTSPRWTEVDGTQAACGTCHGNPPPAPHPDRPNCAICHPATVSPDGTIDVAGGQHIDGAIEVAQGCSGCHGGEAGNAAPPRDLDGARDTTTMTVGAHQSHLGGSLLSAPVACSACHVVPQNVGDPGHIDPAPVELTFSAFATAGGTLPTAFDAGTGQCSNVYCHGATVAGGAASSPLWNVVDGSQKTCGSCHGNPPPAPHPANPNCWGCHPNTVRPDGTIDLAAGQHIDGDLDLAQGCSDCHGGDAANAAPPRDLMGRHDTASLGVGAHQRHLGASVLRGPIACADCHTVPAGVMAPGHLDAAPAELTFSVLATGGGTLAPAFNPATGACANVYCHGGSLTGGTVTAPIWNIVDGSQMACGTCHGNPPPAPHPDRTQCAICHPNTVQPDGKLNVAGGQHIDGDVDVAQGCAGCHGGDNGNAAPPRDLNGNHGTAAMTVGAHQSHLGASVLRGPIACTECHIVPADLNAPGHLDAAPADLTFGGLATGSGALAPTFDPATGRCANVYCHGATMTGGTNVMPVWNVVDGSQMACGTCHGNPPPAPHPDRPDCNTCHERTVGATGQLLVADGEHMDGQVELNGNACNACHGSATNAAPPVNLAGASDTNSVGVGAHQSHLVGGAIRGPLGCSSCHVVPAAVTSLGHLDAAPADVSFGVLAVVGGATPSWDHATQQCSNTYCHGANLNAGGTNHTPRWTTVDGSQMVCGTCHGNPPPAPHPASNDCATCHPATVNADGTINVAGGTHVNGATEIDGTNCLACHASAQSAGLVRRQVVGAAGDFVKTSHHVTNGTVNQVVAVGDCSACHDQTAHMGLADPQVLLRDADGAASVTFNGQGASLETFCLACHDADSEAGVAPFSDGAGPPNVETLWLTGSHNTSPAASLAQEACFACHGGADSTRPNDNAGRNAHGSTLPVLLSPKVNGVAVANGEEAICLACHSGQVAAKNIATELAKANLHGVAAQTGVHQVNEAPSGTRTHVECVDCHDPHGSNTAAAVGQGPSGNLRGVSGIDTNGVGVTPATLGYQVCYKCHSDSAQVFANAVTRQFAQSSLRADFDAANPTFHPIEAVGRNATVPSLIAPWTVNSRMTCMDCHNNNTGPGAGGVGPKGPHGSTYPYILERRYDMVDRVSEAAALYALCYKCHNRASIRGDASFPYHLAHINGYATPCTTCHDPHGVDASQGPGVTNLVNFDRRYVSPYNGVIRFIDTGTRHGSCQLTCHGATHGPRSY